MAVSDNKGALTVNEFCSWASISRAKFYREVTEGRIRVRKIGRKSVVIVTEARSWLENLPVGGSADVS